MSALKPQRICLTGPARESAAKRWIDAVWAVEGWKPLHLPLVRVVPVAIHAKGVMESPDMVAVTSSNALPALRRLWDERPDVREAPHAAVGTATARALRTLGVDPKVVGPAEDSGAAMLAEDIIKATEEGQTVLWPRSNRATELREKLVLAGRIVENPVAYRTEDIEDTVVPASLDAVFFASPSAVRVWLRDPESPRVTAIAIGSTTHAELAPEYARFTRILRLTTPAPKSLTETLATLPTR